MLIARRGHGDGRGKAELIGGFVEAGETLEEALRREAKEEAGLDLRTMTYFNSYIGTYSDGRKVLSVVFVCIPDKQPMPTEECTSFEWVSETPSDMFADCDRAALDQYFRRPR